MDTVIITQPRPQSNFEKIFERLGMSLTMTNFHCKTMMVKRRTSKQKMRSGAVKYKLEPVAKAGGQETQIPVFERDLNGYCF